MPDFIKETTQFLSADGKTQVAGFFYTPADTAPKAVIQLSHGMCEYICRYEPMFSVLCRAGFAFCGNDHLGHGYTSPDTPGFAAEKDGHKYLLKDLYTMNRLGHEKYPGLPYFLLGHSMGSFYARWFAELHGDVIDGLIISGTGGPNPLMPLGRRVSGLLSKLRGPKSYSKFMESSSNGAYAKHFAADKDEFAWLSRDPAVWDAYRNDPLCGFSFTVSAYHDMLTVYTHVNTADWAARLNKELPIFLYSGDDDPVGSYGKGVEKVNALLRDAQIADLTFKLYPGARHEVHNETNRDELFADLTAWLEAHI